MLRFIREEDLVEKYAEQAFIYKGHRCWASKAYFGEGVGFDIITEVEPGWIVKTDEILNKKDYEEFKKKVGGSFDEDRCVIMTSIKNFGDKNKHEKYLTLGEAKKWKPTMRDVFADGKGEWMTQAATVVYNLLSKADISKFARDHNIVYAEQKYKSFNRKGDVCDTEHTSKTCFAFSESWVTSLFTSKDPELDMSLFYTMMTFWRQYVHDEWRLLCRARFGVEYNHDYEPADAEVAHVGITLQGKNLLLTRNLEYGAINKGGDDLDWKDFDLNKALRSFELSVVDEFPEDAKIIDIGLLQEIADNEAKAEAEETRRRKLEGFHQKLAERDCDVMCEDKEESCEESC